MKRTAAALMVALIVAIMLSGAIAGCVKKEFPKPEPEFQITPADYVNPFIGTDGGGHTFPGACVPFGMVGLSPDTTTGITSGYRAADPYILGFSHTHLSGTGGRGDWGDILFMPTVGELKTTGFASRFKNAFEKAEAGYYSVQLLDYGIKAELTATARVGVHNYTFQHASPDAHILIDLNHGIGDRTTDANIRIVNETSIEGCRISDGWALGQRIYFVAEFSKPCMSYGTWNGGAVNENKNMETGTAIGAFMNYAVKNGESIIVRVGISATGVEGARKNLKAEVTDFDFEKVKMDAKEVWNKELSKIEVEGSTEEKAIFYTALYHAFIHPSTFSDVDGKYLGVDGNIHESTSTQYTVFSLWDTFRAEHPLLVLTQPQRTLDMINTSLSIYKDGGGNDGGWLPRWYLWNYETGCMIGTHMDSVIADAYVKGLMDFDAELAYEAMYKDATKDPTEDRAAGKGGGRLGLNYYMLMGYVPCGLVGEATSRTLEYAYTDFCIAAMANLLGKEDDIINGTINNLTRRAQNYRNVFDPTLPTDPGTYFMRGKYLVGVWANLLDFDPTYWYPYYTEGNALTYTWFVPHDVQGLMELMGKDRFIERLDQLLAKNVNPDWMVSYTNYWHGNEPSHHIPYLYDFAGQPWKTQEKVRNILYELHNTSRAGLCGNDDCGQMSAWYVFSAMGFYPFCPGMPIYTIGSPIFEKVTIHLDNGKDIIIEARNVSRENKYIQSAILNGQPWNKPWFWHSDIADGGELIFEMGPEPNTIWGSAPEDAPPSMSSFIYGF